ncbi:hypothetical protein BH24ACI3_BH24ACI3_05370 [soil metagenome]
MKHLTGFVFRFGIILSFSGIVFAQGVPPVCHSFTTGNSNYTQNFDTLASTGTSSVVPPGFGFAESSGTNAANSEYSAGTGSSTTGDTYSFGSTGASERAFGGLQTGSLIPTIGACFTNNTGAAITSFTVTYDGEMWRLGATGGRLDRLDFQYSLNATTLLDGTATWTDVNGLDFVTPNTSGDTAGARDGNEPLFRTAGITAIVGSLSIPNGATWYIRYLDFNASGADDGLAVDNFSMLVGAGATSAPVTVSGRVLAANGKSISGARVTVEGGNLQSSMSAMTNPFGYFRLEGLSSGETYIVTIGSKRYAFAEPTRVVSPQDNITDLDFVAMP